MYAMLKPSRVRVPQRVVQTVHTMLPPVRGLNTTGAIAGMPETDALQIDNLLSTELGLTVREGWREYATNIGGDDTSSVRTVMPFNGAGPNAMTNPLIDSFLFAATDDGIFDIEGGGDLALQPAEIALSGVPFAGYMQAAQFTTDSGQYLIACSETDGAFLFDGLTWMKMTSAGGPGPGIITGVDPASFVHVCVWKKRLLFTQRGSSVMWFLDVGAIGGVAQSFDFGPQFANGGYLVGLAAWTQDDGAGVDDRLCVIGSSGDLAIYFGTDPADPTQFATMGSWFIGPPPVGRRSFTTTGGNVYILTVYGVVPVNQIVQGGLDNILTANTELLKQLRKIQDRLNSDFATLLHTPGWELLSIPTKALLLVRRPSVSVTEHIQYAFQQHSAAWSTLLDIPAQTFARRLNEVYGGTDNGRVLRVLDANTDGMLIDGTGEFEIRSRLTPAFTYLGTPAIRKLAQMLRLTFLATEEPGFGVLMNVDFAVTTYTAGGVPGGPVGSLWDASLWDQAYWAGGPASFGEWRSVEGLGYALSPTIFISSEAKTVLASIEYMVVPGGPL